MIKFSQLSIIFGLLPSVSSLPVSRLSPGLGCGWLTNYPLSNYLSVSPLPPSAPSCPIPVPPVPGPLRCIVLLLLPFASCVLTRSFSNSLVTQR